MFEHSVRVPRHFKVAANIFKKVSTEGGSIKTLLYDSKLRHYNTNVLFALLTETIKHAADLDKIFEDCSLLKNEPRLDPWLAKVLITELLYGKKKLPGQSKPEQTILSYQQQFEKFTSEHQDELKTEEVRRPRYVRINTILLTTSDAIRAFQDEGYHFIRCTSGSYEDYLKQIQGLTEYDFTQDYHVKTIFVFSSGTRFHNHELYLENKIILQDRATAMAVHLLAAPPGSVALDMCAAPGMKTTQLAAYIRNEGKIYAVERNEKRYEILCDFVEKTGSKCVETVLKDALEIKRGDYDDVEYILLDPSCSGSGMELSVHNYIEATRLAKLTSLQEKFLKHAMNSFPKAKRIVYSTCSIFPEENERVITNIVKASRAKWRVQDVKEILKGQWNNFGSGMYGSMGTRCLYAKPDSDFTTGFFLAVLDRDPKDLEKSLNPNNDVEKVREDLNSEVNGQFNEATGKKKKKSGKGNKKDMQSEQLTETIDHSKVVAEDTSDEITKKKKKKKHKNSDNNEPYEECAVNNFEADVTIDETSVDTNVVSKKKKDKNRTDVNDSNLNEFDIAGNVEKPKKKKRKIDTETKPSEDQVEPVNQKKKKSKHSSPDNDGGTEADTEIVEKVKKKKKKKREVEVQS